MKAMKKIYLKVILMAICALVMQGCGQSREKKAEAIVKEIVPKMLNDASSYEPVQTRVDSALATIYFDPEAAQAAYRLIELKSEEDDLKLQYNDEKSSAAIWSGPYTSNFGREQLRQAREKMGEVEKKLNKVLNDKAEQEQIIKERNKSIDSSKFNGWMISHRFRCANGFGVKRVQDIAILVDEKIENPLMLYNLDDEADDGFKNLKSIIDEVLEK